MVRKAEMDKATMVIEWMVPRYKFFIIGSPLRLKSRRTVQFGINLALQSSSGPEIRKASTLITVSSDVLYLVHIPSFWPLDAIGCQSSVLKYHWEFSRIPSDANANHNIVDRVVHQPGRWHPYLRHPEVTWNAKGLAS